MSEINFDYPTRQSYAAIALIIYRFYKTLVKQLWPFLIVFVIGGRFTQKKEILVGIAFFAFSSTIFGIISFFKYYFYIQSDELIIEKGVIRKTKTSIPLDRIQSIDFEQNLIHRLLNVVRVKIDTAGSSGEELNLHALNRSMADELRNQLLKGKVNLQGSTEINESTAESPKNEILAIDLLELIKLGISANHFKSAWLIFIFFFWIYENLEDAGVNVGVYKDYLPDSSIILQSIAIVLSFILFFIIASFLFSLIRTVLQYFNLKLYREKNKFKITAGLINKKETAALDNKIQIVSWSQNVLQKILRLYELSLRQAQSAEVKLKKTILIPGIKKNQIAEVSNYLFEGQNQSIQHLIRTHSSYFTRYGTYITLISALILVISFYFEAYNFFILVLIIAVYQLVALFLRYKKYAIGLNEDLFFHRSGSFGSRFAKLSIHKIQSLSLRQNIYQRRHQLADLIVNTAGGYLRIPFIPYEEAKKIVDTCLMKVETSSKTWM